MLHVPVAAQRRHFTRPVPASGRGLAPHTAASRHCSARNSSTCWRVPCVAPAHSTHHTDGEALAGQLPASPPPSPPPPPPPSSGPGQAARRVLIRRCTAADAPGLAKLCAETFRKVALPSRGEPLSEAQLEAIAGLEARYAESIETTVLEKLTSAFSKKIEAQQESREHQLWQQAQRMRSEIARLRGGGNGAERPQPLAKEQRSLSARWRRNRMFACLAAFDADSGALLGALVLSLMRPEAWLPPPFPSTKPLRLYISNMAVAEEHRRRGVARALLLRSEQLGQRWGHDSLWLHVRADNAAGAGLYHRVGFVDQDPGAWKLLGPWRQRLLVKPLPSVALHQERRQRRQQQLQQQRDAASAAAAGAEAGVDDAIGGVTRPSDGVFIWGGSLDDEPVAAAQDAAPRS